MRIAILTDTHFGVRGDSIIFARNQERFYQEIFFPKIDELGIDTVLHLGDFWDNRKSLTLVAIERARKFFFDEIEKRNIKLKILYGNHDVAMRNTNWPNSLDFVEKMYPKNVHVVKTHEVFNFDGLPIAMISWVNKENLADSLEFINTAPAKILCGHFEIKSFEMTPGNKNDHGFDKELFERYEKVWSGHFHTMSSDGRIEYISNTNQFNWSDYNLKKGFRILETDTQKLTFVENPFNIYEKFIYTDDVDVLNFDYEQYREKVTRVYIQSFATTNQQKLNLFVERLSGSYNVEVLEVNETSYDGELTEDDLKDVGMDKVIGMYIDDVVQNDLIDKNRLKTYFLDLYNEALSTTDNEA